MAETPAFRVHVPRVIKAKSLTAHRWLMLCGDGGETRWMHISSVERDDYLGRVSVAFAASSYGVVLDGEQRVVVAP